jgi:organic hydroperoxide reductase OsmC/OhrA
MQNSPSCCTLPNFETHRRDLMAQQHQYRMQAEWTGNTGEGTSTYKSYERSVTISAEGKPNLLSSADPAFRGDSHCWNPEELLVASLSTCHMLSYLHLCVLAGIVVVGYKDQAEGTMSLEGGTGRMTLVTLHPEVIITDESKCALAKELHEKAHKQCFIANSVNFTVESRPTINVKA